MIYKFQIKNLDCANCANKLEQTLQKIEGIERLSLSFMTEKLVFQCREENKEELVRKICEVILKNEPKVQISEVSKHGF